jgi:hypothetical protein
VNARRIARGDWQTPLDLARRIVAMMPEAPAPAAVLEPTCGDGSFLLAAAEAFPDAVLAGWEIDRCHAETARALVPRASIAVESFFDVDWEHAIATLPDPILVLGNPPWVTNARLGVLGSRNLPKKQNTKRLPGLEARTGNSNFDISEHMILALLDALRGRDATVALICKSSVARRVIEAESSPAMSGELRRIDAMEHFDASVDAVLFVAKLGTRSTRWPVYASLDTREPIAVLGVENGACVADADRFERTRGFIGTSNPEWRSGLKHDCARVMELERVGTSWMNGNRERVRIEEEHVFPLLKSSDVVHGRIRDDRAVIVTQRSLGEDTKGLPPKTWSYLERHRASLEARKSSIYEGQPPFAIFGIGPYAFAPWKVAISGLYKRFSPMLVGPQDGRPVMLDDTCYFLPFAEESEARSAFDALRSPLAADFFAARIFWDAKRPIRKSILQTLDLRALEATMRECSKV